MERATRTAPPGTSAPGRGAFMAAVLVALVAAAPLHAQSGDGYLFGRPQASVSVRGGFSHATAGSDLFDDVTKNLTLRKSDFSGATVGVQVALAATERLDIALDGGYMSTTTPSHYRNLVDNANQEIEQTTKLQRVPLTLNARLYLSDRGRSIGRFAWIPSSVAPWVGAGGGLMWYRFRQEGDFVDANTNSVFHDAFNSEGFTPMAQAMAGLDVTISPRLAATGEARYLFAHSRLSADFDPAYQPLDLSGVVLTLGLTARL